jgi:hypothetical protein
LPSALIWLSDSTEIGSREADAAATTCGVPVTGPVLAVAGTGVVAAGRDACRLAGPQPAASKVPMTVAAAAAAKLIERMLAIFRQRQPDCHGKGFPPGEGFPPGRGEPGPVSAGSSRISELSRGRNGDPAPQAFACPSPGIPVIRRSLTPSTSCPVRASFLGTCSYMRLEFSVPPLSVVADSS